MTDLIPCFLTEKEEYKEVELIYEKNKGNVEKKDYQNHHKIPKCYFDAMGIDVDNSESNLVYLHKKTHKKVHRLLAECVNPELKNITGETKEGENINAYNLIRINMLVAGGFFDDELTKEHYELYKKNPDRCSRRLVEMFNPNIELGNWNGRQKIFKITEEMETPVFWRGLYPRSNGKCEEWAFPIKAWKKVYGDSLKFDFEKGE